MFSPRCCSVFACSVILPYTITLKIDSNDPRDLKAWLHFTSAPLLCTSSLDLSLQILTGMGPHSRLAECNIQKKKGLSVSHFLAGYLGTLMIHEVSWKTFSSFVGDYFLLTAALLFCAFGTIRPCALNNTIISCADSFWSFSLGITFGLLQSQLFRINSHTIPHTGTTFARFSICAGKILRSTLIEMVSVSTRFVNTFSLVFDPVVKNLLWKHSLSFKSELAVFQFFFLVLFCN